VKLLDGAASACDAERGIEVELVALRAAFVGATDPFNQHHERHVFVHEPGAQDDDLVLDRVNRSPGTRLSCPIHGARDKRRVAGDLTTAIQLG
jgi:hypothetical protein